MGDLVVGLVNGLFGLISILVYELFVLIYNLFFDIANTQIIRSTVGAIGKNVYAILGVIMLFKLAFSIITYIINPDQFTNKETGFGAIIKNVFIVIVLIITVPLIFDMALNLQTIILQEDIIGRIITGQAATDTEEKRTAGGKMAFSIVSGFVRPDNSKGELPDCENFLSGNKDDFDKCVTQMKSKAKKSSIIDDHFVKAYDEQKFTQLLNFSLLNAKLSSGELIFTFDWITAIAVGLFATYIILLFCLDIAVRSVKFTFLQMIAPIPIISYVDPKSKKSVFDKWVNVSVKTYFDLFIRIAAIYLAIFLIQCILAGGDGSLTKGMVTITGYDETTGQPIVENANFFVKIFMIMGTLLFAKQLPKLLEDLTGLKLDGEFQLGMANKLGQVPIVGGRAAAAWTLGRNAVGMGAQLGLGAAGVGLTRVHAAMRGGNSTVRGRELLDRANQRRLANRDRADRLSKVWSRSFDEAEERIAASGMGGGKYSGETAWQRHLKDEREERKKARESHDEINRRNALYREGRELIDRPGGITKGELKYKAWLEGGGVNGITHDPDTGNIVWDDNTMETLFNLYQNAGYTSEQYIKSLISIERAKSDSEAATRKLTNDSQLLANEQSQLAALQNAITQLDPATDSAKIDQLNTQITEITARIETQSILVEEDRTNMEKASKQLSKVTETHEQHIKTQHEHDRRIEEARSTYDDGTSFSTPHNDRRTSLIHDTGVRFDNVDDNYPDVRDDI